MEAMVYKSRQAINLLTVNITKWGTKKKVVENTSPIGREARKCCGRGCSIGDPFCGVHQSIGADHP